MTASNFTAVPAFRPQTGRVRWWHTLFHRWQAWRRARRSRRELDRLSEDQLADIGLTRTPEGYRAQTSVRERELRLMREMSKIWGNRL
ncbi:DUF1127 domain-containing protein [Stappia stellulata]|uniref:DUF1127 domain-containing protein n=1 Tax=Stappia stellulata TaxID=71235 RepID=UPI0005693CC9|nr:DUF1127 domain-containing protein [Stappia stellulata]